MLSLVLLTVALTGGFVVFARAKGTENPLKGYGFDMCDGKPCFMGVVAGKTAWRDVEELTKDNLILQDVGRHIVAKFRAVSVEFYGDANDANVVKFSVYLPYGTLSQLGDAVALYGTPCGTDPLYGITTLQGVFVRFPYLSVGVIAQGSVNPLQNVSAVNFSSTSGCPAQDYLRWSGFALSNRYEGQWQAGQDS